MAVSVSVLLGRKSDEVVTISPDADLTAAARSMAEHDIGALVVTSDGRSVDGIVSERDLVRAAARIGPGFLERAVSEVMTRDVTTCSPETTVDELMAMMTERRIRHVPVLASGALAGIVSIGDVVKSRLDQLELEAEALERYVTGSA